MGKWSILGGVVTWRPRPYKAIGFCLKAEQWVGTLFSLNQKMRKPAP